MGPPNMETVKSVNISWNPRISALVRVIYIYMVTIICPTYNPDYNCIMEYTIQTTIVLSSVQSCVLYTIQTTVVLSNIVYG